MDRTIIKFSHCNKCIYCFSFQNIFYDSPDMQSDHGISADSVAVVKKSNWPHCPVCNECLKFGLVDAPVSIPIPFSDGHKVPFAFTIGSRQGPLFISEWDNSELHVGITNSEGVVYNYTLAGVQRDRSGWEQCIAERLVQPGANGVNGLWDQELERFSSLDMWAPKRFYEEREFGSCCYAFVLAFINLIRDAEGEAHLTRDEFTENHVLPKMKIASKYVKIYREICHHGFSITEPFRQ